ncbi:MAG: hypothetical protein NZ572_07990 [Thermoflexus sp.]|nr:hypothetical protein [Thermoflexus sp.]
MRQALQELLQLLPPRQRRFVRGAAVEIRGPGGRLPDLPGQSPGVRKLFLDLQLQDPGDLPELLREASAGPAQVIIGFDELADCCLALQHLDGLDITAGPHRGDRPGHQHPHPEQGNPLDGANR